MLALFPLSYFNNRSIFPVLSANDCPINIENDSKNIVNDNKIFILICMDTDYLFNVLY